MQKSVKNPFAEDYQFFKSIPLEKRAEFNKNLLDTPQLKGEFKVYKAEYPSNGIWEYKGYKLHYSSYQHSAEKEPRGVVFSLHGLNAHGASSAYTFVNVAQKLKIDVYALDFMNFGRSEGPFRGQITSLQELVSQSEEFIEFIMSKYKSRDSIKKFIAGLSLGGSICFKLCLKNPAAYSGVIFFSPALRQNAQSQPFMKKLGKVMGKLFPRAKLIAQTFNAHTKYDQTQKIMEDPYIYKDKVVPGSVKVVLESMEQISSEFAKFENSYVLFQSGVDKLVDPFAPLDLEVACKSKDKTTIYCKDMWHAVFGEEQIEHIVPLLTQWLSQRIN